MTTRKMSAKQYDAAILALQRYARKEPFQMWYETDLRVEDTLYRLTLYPGKGRKITALQALRITRDRNGEKYRLLSANALLLGLVEIWLSQVEDEA